MKFKKIGVSISFIVCILLLLNIIPAADTNPPIINSITDSPDPVNKGENILITANITDNIKVDSAWVNINNINYSLNNGNSIITLFYDGFESGSLVNWSLSGVGTPFTTSTASPFNGTRHLSAEPANLGGSFIEKSINPYGYDNIAFSFYVITPFLDTGDSFQVDWYNGTSWINLMITHNEAEDEFLDASGYKFFGFSLPSYTKNLNNISIRLGCKAGGVSERCNIDDFSIKGIIKKQNIFYDGFESGSLVNWSLSGAGAAFASITTNPLNGARHIRAVPQNLGGSFIQTSINPYGYDNLGFSFYTSNSGLDAGDAFQVDWYNGTQWISLLVSHQTGTDEFSGVTNYRFFGFSLPSYVKNLNNISIRLGCIAGGVSELCDVDDFNIDLASSYDLWNYTYNTSNLNSGTYNYTVYANDTSNNLANSQIGSFDVISNVTDTTPPATITNLNSPIQGTTWIFWNWTNPQDLDFNHTEIWVDGIFITNISSQINFYNATGLVSNTSYQISTRTSDNSGNINTSWVNNTASTLPIIVIDTTSPSYSSIIEPSDPSNYIPLQNYEFNISWIDDVNVDSIIINFNGINYTNAIKNGNIWSKTFTDLAVGTYNYTWYANDTSNNWNNTGILTFTINKVSPILTLTSNPSWNETYGTQTIINCTSNILQIIPNLYRNGVLVSIPDTQLLGASTYNYECNTSGNQNYTSGQVLNTLIINKTVSILNLTLNNQSNNISIQTGNSVIINSELSTPTQGYIEIYQNNILINNGSSPLTNTITYDTVGTYNITSIYLETTNYTSSSKTYFVEVSSTPTQPPPGGGGGNGEPKQELSQGQVKQEIKNELSNLFETMLPNTKYIININNPELALNQVSVTVKNEFNNGELYVVKLSKEQVENNLKGTNIIRYINNTYDSFEINSNLEDNIEEILIRFSVKKSWLNEHNIDKGMIIMYRYHDKPETLDTWIENENSEEVQYVARSNGLSMFTIIGEEPLEKPLNKVTGASIGARISSNEIIVVSLFLISIGYLTIHLWVSKKRKDIKIKRKNNRKKKR